MVENKKAVAMSQLRSFGFIVAGGFTIIGLLPFLIHQEPPRMWSLGIAGFLTVLGLVFPRSLTGFYRLWMIIGSVLGWINTRIILAVGFYGILMPMGLVMRIVGKDPMRRRFDTNAKTYRVNRSPRQGSHMKNQY